jgi:hypothetical protein
MKPGRLRIHPKSRKKLKRPKVRCLMIESTEMVVIMKCVVCCSDSSHGHHPSRNGVGSLFSHKSQPSMSTTSSIGSQDPLLASTRTPVEQHEIFALATGTLIRESLSYEGEAANPMIFPEPASPSSPTPITEELIIDATQSPGRGDSMGIFFRRGSNDPLPRRKPSSAEMVVTQKAHTRTSST